MVPDDENISAFAAYSGAAKKTISRNQKRRLKSRELHLRMQDKAMDLEVENILKIKKSKKKKKNIAATNSGSEEPSVSLENLESIDSTPITNGKKKILLIKKKKTKNTGSNQLKKSNIIETDIPDKDEEVVISSNSDSKISKPKKKNRRKKRKISDEDVSFEQSGQATSISGIDCDNIFPNKISKKVCISSPEPNLRSEKRMKKPIVSTPRFVKPKRIIKDFVSKKQVIEISPSKTLQKVDEYLTNKKETEAKLTKIGSAATPKSQKIVKDIQLAQKAITEAQLKKNSEAAGNYSFEKILEPLCVETFMRENWEKAPLHIPAQNHLKFSKLISTEKIDAILRDRIVNFGKHLDITSYTNGVRETHNLEGRANAHVVWDFYSNGCSVRLLNPQYFFHNVHGLNAIIQEYFGCFVGANSYLTPPMTQGFAPHYDDIEAFILQIEGSKVWKLYQPMDKNGYLPRNSSRNLTEEEIGEPIFEVKLNPGDVLYFPRGYIHQGRTEKEHSLHLTLSVYQKTAWCDLLEKILPLTLKKAASQDVEFRRGLPIGYLKSAGLAHKNQQSRKDIVRKVKKLITRLNDFLETDTAIDQMGLSFIRDALPPVLTTSEAARTVAGDGWKMRANGELQGQVLITIDTKVRWTRAFCYRILEEEVTLEEGTIEKQVRIYHTLENSREYRAEEPQYLVIDPSMLNALRHLTSAYPDFTKVSDLPDMDEDEKILFVSDLWDRKLLMTDEPLESYNSSKSSGETEQSLTSEELKILSDLDEKIPKGDESEPSSSGSGSDPETEELTEDESISISDEDSDSDF